MTLPKVTLTHLIGTWLGMATACIAVVALGNHLCPPAPAASPAPTERFTRDVIEENWRLRADLFEERCKSADLAAMVARDRTRRERARVPYSAVPDDATDPADLIPPQRVPVPTRPTGQPD